VNERFAAGDDRLALRVGFVGLGAAGTRIVPRLLAARHDVVGWNRTSENTNCGSAAYVAI